MDWITANTSKDLKFELIEFKPAGIQVSGNVAVAYYWITARWLDKSGSGNADTIRITHTWVRTGSNWQILGGMSAPEAEARQK